MKLFRLIFILQSYLLLIFIYLINHSISIGQILIDLSLTFWQEDWPDLPNCISYLIYLVTIVVSTILILKWMKNIGDEIDIEVENINSIYPASDSFLPTFFAYIFLGLSINNWITLLYVYVALGIFCMCSGMYLYNPLLYIFSYRFYYLEMSSGTKIIIISKLKFQMGHKIDFEKVKKINDFTYVDLNKH